jgi:N-acyl-D-amino-acid deacylase
MGREPGGVVVTYDVVVRNGLIVDGTGQPAYGGDVAIQDGRIVAMGEVVGDARRTIDADGHVVAPGFIDAHTHYDAQLLWDPYANPSTAHGITTVLLGNCGYTLAPVRGDDQDYLMGLFAAAEEVPKKALQQFAPFAWESFPEYLDWMAGRLGINVLTQVGHSAVRRFVMGAAALERAATDDEIAEMVRLVEAAMDAGAAGISSSQAPHQRGEYGEHIPSYFAADDETRALAEAVRRKGKRLLSINPASKRDGLDDEDRALLVRLADLSGAVVSWNDLGMGTPNGDSALEFMEAELERGREIYAVARCQRGETRFTLKKLSAVFATSEAWVDLSRLDPADKLAALADPGWRARLGEFWATAKFMANASVEKAGSDATRPLEGRLLADIAAERGVSAPEVMFDVAIEDQLETFFRISGPVNVDESRLERILKSPATLVGISDGGAHLQTFAGGDYTSYFLAHWVREKGVFTLEEGVAALSSRIAEFLGLTDRGTLAVGMAADVVVFDPEIVEPMELLTLDDIPGGGTRMTKNARGIPWVLVNGEPVVEDGKPTAAVSGRVLGR